DQLLEHVLAALNASELARRQFRDIARISGLVFQGYPGRGKTDRQLQASTGLLYDTLARYDPEHMLLDQARREVLEDQLDMRRLRAVLERAAEQELIIMTPKHFSPLGFPLWVDRLRGRLSTENWRQRVQRLLATLERNADRVAKKRRGTARWIGSWPVRGSYCMATGPCITPARPRSWWPIRTSARGHSSAAGGWRCRPARAGTTCNGCPPCSGTSNRSR